MSTGDSAAITGQRSLPSFSTRTTLLVGSATITPATVTNVAALTANGLTKLMIGADRCGYCGRPADDHVTGSWEFCQNRLTNVKRRVWVPLPKESDFSSAPLDGTRLGAEIAETAPEANRRYRWNMWWAEIHGRRRQRNPEKPSD